MKICVHTFTVGDVDDAEIYAAEPIWKWQQTEAGKWIMENAAEKPYYSSQPDYMSWGYKFGIYADLTEEQASYYILKFGKF